jgi:tetratricopeptide (TPR) repeat protein
MLRMDQRRRWQQGDRLAVEVYLKQEPALEMDAEAVLELIYNEVVLREEAADPPRLEEYLDRFPAYADQLRIQFEVHRALEGNALTSSPCLLNKHDFPSPTSVVLGQEDAGEARGDDWGQSRSIPFSSLGRGPSPLARGASLPGYEILEELGRGGMGIVYRARQVALKRLVALKVVLAGAHAGPKERASFRTEAEAVARLQHPHIVQIHDIGEHEGLPYFSLEYIDGPNLEQKAGGQPMPYRQATEIVETIAQAVHYAHQQGIIHRDLKPSNILLSGEIPKITDFGVAKLLDAESGHTPSGDFVGTPHYMAPEQALGQSKGAGPAADVYSLGAILYHLLAGRPPFKGGTVYEVLEQVRWQEPDPPSRAHPHLPRDLDTVCLKCLEKDPHRRYASAHELAEDLRRLLADKPIQARPTARWERVWKWAKRRPATAALMAVSAIAVCLLLALALWHESEVRLESARSKYRHFLQRRDDAVFHGVYGTSFADADAALNLQAARTAAEDALAAVGVTMDAPAPPVPNPYLTDRENAEVRAGCYELLLVLAESFAYPLDGQKPADRKQRLRQALTLLEQAAQLRQPTLAHRLRQARYLRRLGERMDGERSSVGSADGEAATASDHFFLGHDHLLEGNIAQAASDFQMALQKRPDHFWSHFFLALCYLRMQSPAAANASVNECVAQRPDFAWTYLLRSMIHENRNELDAAETDYDTALALDVNEDERYFLDVNRGRMRFRHGRLEKAAADLKQAIALKPASFWAYLYLARVCQKHGSLDESDRQLARAIDCKPPPEFLAQCHAERARNLYTGGQYAAAVATCNEALKAAPGQTDALFLEIQALMKLKRFAETLPLLEDYSARGGQKRSDFYRARGQARLHLGKHVDAMADFTHVLEHEPDAEIYRYRGWACYFAQAWKAGLDDFNKAIQSESANSKNADAYTGRGLCRVMLGDYREATVDADNALARAPGTPEMLHNIACIFALAAARVKADSEAKDAPRLASTYCERAVNLLGQALVMVPQAEQARFWRDKVMPDAALDAIRAAQEFRTLAERYTLKVKDG